MPQQKPSQQKVIVIDQKNEKKLMDDSKIIHDFGIKMRSGGLKLGRCVLAMRDPDSVAMMGLAPISDRNKLLVEILFDSGLTKKKQEIKMQEAELFIMSSGHKILAKKLFEHKDDPDNNIAKFIISL